MNGRKHRRKECCMRHRETASRLPNNVKLKNCVKSDGIRSQDVLANIRHAKDIKVSGNQARPVVRLRGLGKQNTFVGGEEFCYYYNFKQIFWAQYNLGENKKYLGVTASEWSRGCGPEPDTNTDAGILTLPSMSWISATSGDSLSVACEQSARACLRRSATARCSSPIVSAGRVCRTGGRGCQQFQLLSRTSEKSTIK